MVFSAALGVNSVGTDLVGYCQTNEISLPFSGDQVARLSDPESRVELLVRYSFTPDLRVLEWAGLPRASG